jgi:hypothetical protein
MTHYFLPVNSKNQLTLTHTFKVDSRRFRSIRERITFIYRCLGVVRSCTVKIPKKYLPVDGGAMVSVDLLSGGPVPFKKATATLSWAVDDYLKRVDLNLCDKTHCDDSVWDHVPCLQIVTDKARLLILSL